MDPNVCVREALYYLDKAQEVPRHGIAAAEMRLEAKGRWHDLIEWLQRGGFEPSNRRSFAVLQRYMRMYGAEIA